MPKSLSDLTSLTNLNSFNGEDNVFTSASPEAIFSMGGHFLSYYIYGNDQSYYDIPFHIHVYVPQQLSIEPIDLISLYTNLLDNAIEAASSPNGEVHIVLLQEEKSLYLAVANNYDKTPDLNAFTRKGYTTKGKGHGTGLSSYRRIVARCRGCASRTYLKNGMLIQELHIPAV